MSDPTPEQKSEDRRRGIAAYQGALEAVLAIVIAAGVGYWADQRFGTQPRWLIVGTCIGFGSFVLRLFRMRKLFEDAPPGNKGTGG
jgi:F0F1-type ATP synthase assembly protein I